MDVPTESTLSASKPRARLPYLGLVVLAEIILLLWLLPNDLMWVRWLRRVYEQRRVAQTKWHIQELMRNDPRLGAPAPPLPIGSLPHFLPDAPTILIFVGACNSCQMKALIDWQEIYGKWRGKLNIVAVSRDTWENIATFRKYHKAFIPMLPDADGKIARQYNAVWTPRIYGVREGKIVYVQKDQPTGMLPADIARWVAGTREKGQP